MVLAFLGHLRLSFHDANLRPLQPRHEPVAGAPSNGSTLRVRVPGGGTEVQTYSTVAAQYGPHPQTFAGLSGMGDLVLTCSGDSSRNRRVGLALGQGKKMPEILAEMKQVAEGVKTTKVAKALAQKLGCDAPIIDAMHAIIHEGVPVRDVMTRLLSRPPKMERD